MRVTVFERTLLPLIAACSLLVVSACSASSGAPDSSPSGMPSQSATTSASLGLGDYRTNLNPKQRERYETLDKYRAIDSCAFVDPGAVNRFLSAPLYIGPTSLTGPTGCAFNLNPTKTPLQIDSFTVETESILEPNRRPDENIAGTAVYVDRFGPTCTLSVASPTGLLVGFRTSQAGQTRLFGPAVDVCGPIRGVITASLPRLRAATVTPTAAKRSKGARLDPCSALSSVREQFPDAITISADSALAFTKTTSCQISLSGDKGFNQQATVTVRLLPETNTMLYDDSYSSLRVLGVPGSEGINEYTKCNVEARLGYDQPPITTKSWTTLKIFDVSEEDSENLVDSVKVDGTDCPTAERMAVAVTAAYKALK